MTTEELIKIKDRRNKYNRFSAFNGISITKVEEGYGLVEMDVDQNKINPIGTIHGGCIFTMCDNAGGTAASSFGVSVTTVDASIHYLRPTLNKTHIYAEGRVRKRGKRIIVCDVNVADQDGTELACGVFTYMVLDRTYLQG